MRIVFTGGGTGGHFYPLIAVAEAIEDITRERRLIEPQLFYIGPAPFDPQALQEHDIKHLSSSAGKMRNYSSVLNFFSIFSTFFGIVRSTFQLYGLYPDVIFSTGGYAAFPTLYGARLLRIPVLIYDADAKPGRVSLWSSKFATWITVAHPEAAAHFPEKVRERIVRVGHPIRREIERPSSEGGHEFLKLDADIPSILIMGGSQGARAINDVVIDALPELVKSYNVIHQTGNNNIKEVSGVASVMLKNSPHADRYRPFGLLNALALKMAAGISSLVIARAGSGTIFEIASWGIPSILVPIPLDVSHDQTENAFSYARSGAAEVIEQRNLSSHIFVAEIYRIMNDAAGKDAMKASALSFARPDAAKKIATTIIDIGVNHEPV